MPSKEVVEIEAMTLGAAERLHHASRVIRALKKLPQRQAQNLLTVIVQNPELVEPMKALTTILAPLSVEDREAVMAGAVALVGDGES